MIPSTKLPAIHFVSVTCAMNKLRKIVYPVKKKFFLEYHVPEKVRCRRVNAIAVHSQ